MPSSMILSNDNVKLFECGQEDLDDIDVGLEGGDQWVFCLWPVGDDLFRQVL